MLERITHREMPPGKAGKLSDDEISVVRAWLRAGARAREPDHVPQLVSPVSDQDRQFWSFRLLARPAVPRISERDRACTPIDAFLLERLHARGLGYSTLADRTTLARRVYLDLVGLPPSPAEVDAFVRDDRPHAYESLVDGLLASPHFGERWGRHWLDVAGYVDTVGFDTDATNIITSEGKWLYRDYVIHAFNQDMPYDRFLTEQLAGDELNDWRRAKRFTPPMRDALIATGYLRTARDLTHEDVGVIPQNYFGIMHDTIEIVGTGLLGLTINCARCHSHKFDPIPQEDYYRLMAVLTPAFNPQAWLPVIPTETKNKDRALPDVTAAEQAEIERCNAEVDRRVNELRRSLGKLRSPCEERLFEAKLKELPAPIRSDTKTAIRTPAGTRSEVQKYLADKFAAALTVKLEEVSANMNSVEKAAAAKLEAQISATAAHRRKWGKIQALYDVGSAPPTHLLVRGNEQSPGPEVAPGFLRVLSRTEADAQAKPATPFTGTTGRRSELARWLTRADSPASALVARVMVNRLWKQIFGRGIVPTPDNFGAQGERPTHPELLEWLSTEFVANGWHMKPIIKLMVTSRAYRQASHRDVLYAASDDLGEKLDPGNELLWRMRLRRLESEIVRDAILTASGDLNRKAGGPPVMIAARPDGMVSVATERLANPADRYRRSVYLLTRRAYNLSLLTVFDQPLVATNCLSRGVSAIPLQSLFMINDAFLAEQAEHFARRVEVSASVGCSRGEFTSRAFRMALARDPNPAESATCFELLRRQNERGLSAGLKPADATHQAVVQLCLTLLNTSEFLFAE